MDKQARRAAATAYKERPVDWGVFAVRCAAIRGLWVGASRSVSSHQNRLWFALRTGGCANADAQAAWSVNGEQGFAFEILERFPSDASEFERRRLLKDRAGHWRELLKAQPI
jgi:hypothetical protein